jgi:hypothetical protein
MLMHLGQSLYAPVAALSLAHSSECIGATSSELTYAMLVILQHVTSNVKS